MRRRRFLAASAGIFVTGLTHSSIPFRSLRAASAAGAETGSTALPLLSVAHGPDTGAITAAAIEALGGIGRFVSRGDRVVLKANIGWDRTPEQAANTNPEVLAALTRLCLSAGANSVLVLDNPCNDPRRCYTRSGIQAAVEKAGGRVELFEEARTRKMNVGGSAVKEWPIHPAFVERDVLINVPIAKHHGLAGITLGMKNWLGAIGGPRNRLHQEIDRSIVDLQAFFRPDLTLIDGIRILERGGPQGGSLDDVARLDTVIASADPLAAEVRGAALHGRRGAELPHVRLALERGLGRIEWTAAEEHAIELPQG